MKLRQVRLRNYGNLEFETLSNLRDLNVIIGPNDCGKTHILRAVNKIRELEEGRSPLWKEEKYMREDDKEVEITLEFEEEELKLVSEGSWLALSGASEEEIEDLDTLLCEEGRLESYKGKDTSKFLNDLFADLDSQEKRDISNQVRKDVSVIVNPYLRDISGPWSGRGRTIRPVYGREEEETIDPTLERHGSGVRSLLLLLSEIYAEDPDIILLDEPEVGLNPAAKRSLLHMLTNELLNEYQIILSTQDPAFVNPLFWRGKENRVSVLLYSINRAMQGRESFINVEVNEPNTFAGYMPQSAALRDIHLYVEGPQDVHALHAYLLQYLDENTIDFTNKGEICNRIEIYHLGGHNWRHFLSTIPSTPYFSLVFLDGEMEEEAENVIQRFEESGYSNLPTYVKCDDLEEVSKRFNSQEEIPVYCHGENDMKDFVGVDEKEKIPEKVWEQNSLPREIEELFNSLLKKHVYSTNFPDSKVLEKDWNEANGEWKIEDNELHQREDAGNRVITLNTCRLKNGVFEAKLNSADGEAGQHIIWRGDGEARSNYYLFGTGNLSSDNPTARMGYFQDGNPNWLEKKNVDHNPGEFHNFKVIFQNNSHKLFIDDEFLFEVKDNTHPQEGFVGFHCGKHTAFKDVKIGEEPDFL